MTTTARKWAKSTLRLLAPVVGFIALDQFFRLAMGENYGFAVHVIVLSIFALIVAINTFSVAKTW